MRRRPAPEGGRGRPKNENQWSRDGGNPPAGIKEWHMADYGFSTRSVHAGAQPDPATGARATPIYQTTAFVFEDSDHAAALFNLQVFGNIYSRIMNPTQGVLEEK